MKKIQFILLLAGLSIVSCSQDEKDTAMGVDPSPPIEPPVEEQEERTFHLSIGGVNETLSATAFSYSFLRLDGSEIEDDSFISIEERDDNYTFSILDPKYSLQNISIRQGTAAAVAVVFFNIQYSYPVVVGDILNRSVNVTHDYPIQCTTNVYVLDERSDNFSPTCSKDGYSFELLEEGFILNSTNVSFQGDNLFVDIFLYYPYTVRASFNGDSLERDFNGTKLDEVAINLIVSVDGERVSDYPFLKMVDNPFNKSVEITDEEYILTHYNLSLDSDSVTYTISFARKRYEYVVDIGGAVFRFSSIHNSLERTEINKRGDFCGIEPIYSEVTEGRNLTFTGDSLISGTADYREEDNLLRIELSFLPHTYDVVASFNNYTVSQQFTCPREEVSIALNLIVSVDGERVSDPRPFLNVTETHVTETNFSKRVEITDEEGYILTNHSFSIESDSVTYIISLERRRYEYVVDIAGAAFNFSSIHNSRPLVEINKRGDFCGVEPMYSDEREGRNLTFTGDSLISGTAEYSEEDNLLNIDLSFLPHTYDVVASFNNYTVSQQFTCPREGVRVFFNVVESGEEITDYEGIFVVDESLPYTKSVWFVGSNITVLNHSISILQNEVIYNIKLYDVDRNSWGERFPGNNLFLKHFINPTKEKGLLPKVHINDEGTPQRWLNDIPYDNKTKLYEHFGQETNGSSKHGTRVLFAYCYTLNITKCLEEGNVEYSERISEASTLFGELNSSNMLSQSTSNPIRNGSRFHLSPNSFNLTSASYISSTRNELPPEDFLSFGYPCDLLVIDLCKKATEVENKLTFVGGIRYYENEDKLSRELLLGKEATHKPVLFDRVSVAGCREFENDCIMADGNFFIRLSGSIFSRFEGTSFGNKVVLAVFSGLKGTLFGKNENPYVNGCVIGIIKNVAEEYYDVEADSTFKILSVTDLFNERGEPKSNEEILSDAYAEGAGYISEEAYMECKDTLI